MEKRFYLDANAGVPLLPEVRAALVDALGTAANASSVHGEGRRAREIVETAREKVAGAVGARPQNVVFTSGATEAIAYALSPRILMGEAERQARRLYVGATEHPAVLAGGRFSRDAITILPVTRSGVIDPAALEEALSAHDPADGPPYVALMLANNESGVIHPVAEAAALVKRHGGILLCDAVQALGRIEVDVGALGADFVAFSAHKIGGPQGVGALVLAHADVRPEPLIPGGGQELRRRSGTENVAALAGFGVAAERVSHHLRTADNIRRLRDALEAGIADIAPDAFIAGADAPRLPNTTLFAAGGIAAEVAVIAFDLEGIAVSAGSACSSGKVQASHVLTAMGVGPEVASGGIRVSLPAGADEADIEAFLAAWRGICARMRQSRAA